MSEEAKLEVTRTEVAVLAAGMLALEMVSDDPKPEVVEKLQLKLDTFLKEE